MRVKECMCQNVVYATPETTLTDVAKLMNDNKVGSIPICEDERIVGFVTDRDIVTRGVACNKDCNTTKITDIMNTNVIKVTADTDIEHALEVMSKNQIRRLPVISNEKIIGMLSLGDLAQNEDVDSEDLGYTFECICEDCECHNEE